MQPDNPSNSSLSSAPNDVKSEPLVSRRSRKMLAGKWTALAVAVLVIAVIVVVAILFARGVLYAGIKSSEQKVVLQTRVCGDEIIKKYNGFYVNLATNPADYEGLQTLIIDIKKNDDYKQDPTCQAIVFWYEARYGSIGNAEQALESLKKLKQGGLFVSPDLLGDDSTIGMESAIQVISESATE